MWDLAEDKGSIKLIRARAVQARCVAGMLSPRDARVAEANAVECEDQAREASVGGLKSVCSAIVRSIVDSVASGRGVPKPTSLLLGLVPTDWPMLSKKGLT
jgi:hypothetical protein